MDLSVKNVVKRLLKDVLVVNKCGIAVRIVRQVIGQHINPLVNLQLNLRK